MKIQTGRGTISLMTLLAIWSMSLVVNLPGLAITPILGNLDVLFPHTSQLEIQLLTILPNLLIIPFVLLSGRLSESKNKISIVVVALLIYLLSGVLYLFAKDMTQLILISCLLGVGCGMLIPLAAGMITDTFVGKYRMQQLGIKSGIANISLVGATLIVGWLGTGNWHYPFLVYLLPIIPLLFSFFLRGNNQGAVDVTEQTSSTASQPDQSFPKEQVRGDFVVSRIVSVMGIYFFLSYSVIVISYYLPFLMQGYKMSSSDLGMVTSLFFLAIFLPGFILPVVIRVLKQHTMLVSVLLMAAGLILMVAGENLIILSIASLLMGFGYGVIQPIVYDKAADSVTNQKKETLALSLVLAINYFSITIAPFMMDLFQKIAGNESNRFPFILNFVLMLLFAVVVWLNRKKFAFSMNKDYF
jgi:MFS family permease